MDSEQLHRESQAIRIQVPQTPEREHASPLFLTSSFCYSDAEDMRSVFAGEKRANIYSRFINPSVTELENKMKALEGTEAAFATSSGMSATFATFMSLLRSGDHMLCGRSIFGSTHSMLTRFLPRWGIRHSYFDLRHPDEIEQLIEPETRLIFVETPSNPGLDLVDLAYLHQFAKAHELIFVVDNTFASPVFQQPALFGADLILHAATKWIDGQGRVLGGVVCGKKVMIEEVYQFCRNTGPALSPFNAWVLSKGLETLFIRMEKHSENASRLAQRLTGNPHVEFVKYPFLPSHPQYELARKQMSAGGGVVCFEVKGGAERGNRFLDHLKMLSLTANLGDSRSIASHPASTTHAKLTEAERLQTGITPGLIRISVGLENSEDIIKDIERALKKSE